MQTIVREYRERKAFDRDARRLAREGWRVASTAQQEQSSGCMRYLVMGPLALIFKPKAKIVVTYERQ